VNIISDEEEIMSKRSVALVGVLILLVMFGSAVIGAMSALASTTEVNGSTNLFLPLVMKVFNPQVEVPAGAVMFFNLESCPSGWSELSAAQGRTIVGLPSGGTLTGTVGAGLSDTEDRTHYHNVDPSTAYSTVSGDHTHSVDPPNQSTSMNGSHDHSVSPQATSNDSYTHNHEWSYFTTGANWYSYNSNGQNFMLVNWGNGIGNEGDGYFPLAEETLVMTKHYYTTLDTNTHSHEISAFDTENAGNHNHTIDILPHNTTHNGDHIHQVDIPNTSSTFASTSDVMPYIQLLVCQKD
jgi:hypothetical protein